MHADYNIGRQESFVSQLQNKKSFITQYLPTLISSVFILIISIGSAFGQSVGIGTTTPDSSAALEIKSADKGLLIPSNNNLNIPNPAEGLLVYRPLSHAFYFHNGTQWSRLIDYYNNFRLNTPDNRVRIDLNSYSAGSDRIHFILEGSTKLQMIDSRLEPLGSGHSIFLGEDAGWIDDLTNNYNVFIGYRSGYDNTSGQYNTFTGTHSGGNNATGSWNSFFGHSSGYQHQSGDHNSLFGAYAGNGNYFGYRNTFIGSRAGDNIVNGTDNTSIGYNADFNSSSLANSTAIGANSLCTASNQIVLGDLNVTEVLTHGDVRVIGNILAMGTVCAFGGGGCITLSDARFKDNVSESVLGLEFIKLLRPVQYYLSQEGYNSFIDNAGGEFYPSSFNEFDTNRKTGFIAQEVELAAKSSGFDFSGVISPDDDKGFYTLDYSQFVVPLVKAVQEQQDMIEILEAKLSEKDAELQSLRKANQTTQSRLDIIEAQLNVQTAVK